MPWLCVFHGLAKKADVRIQDVHNQSVAGAEMNKGCPENPYIYITKKRI